MADGEAHLYDEQGRFRFLGKKVGICALCGEKDNCYGVGALAPSSRFCKRCILRTGPKNLRRDANIALRNAKKGVDALKKNWDELQAKYRARFGFDLQIHK